MSFKISIIKKNQVIVWFLTLVLGTAGIINYANDPRRNYDVEISGKIKDPLGEAVLVDSPGLISNVDEYIHTFSEDKQEASEYFAQSRMEREKQFSERMEVYERILSNDAMNDEQIKMAQGEIKSINAEKTAILVAENLIKLKGIGDIVILPNGDNINVVVAEENLTDAKVAQIQNIVQREIGVSVEKIHINNL